MQERSLSNLLLQVTIGYLHVALLHFHLAAFFFEPHADAHQLSGIFSETIVFDCNDNTDSVE